STLDALGVRVQRLPGGTLGWRSRVRYAVDAAGRAGLLQHRSHQVVPIGRCRIDLPPVRELDVARRRWPSEAAIEVVASTGGDVSVRAHPAGIGALDDDPRDISDAPGGPVLDGPAEVLELAAGRRWLVPVAGFWQVHPAPPDT